ncbi:Hypothetical protein FKW44_010729 [Caligus rogercresseyi]|uniref:Uncharacterized protein n=1 Tax=Caligus rogercresseyi TaxID=217165 RepID=A0A7T8HHK3_CALRO|nr:Hypothetical protein FKW44_010729 [Caligus rogercresseyi]
MTCRAPRREGGMDSREREREKSLPLSCLPTSLFYRGVSFSSETQRERDN